MRGERIIKKISLRLSGDSVTYEVGKNGVTEIKPEIKNGEMALVQYYEIWKGDKLVADMHQFSLVEYE